MDILKRVLRAIGHFLLSIARCLQQAICCRRRREPEFLLPMTVDQIHEPALHQTSQLYDSQTYNSQTYDPQTLQWGAWPDAENTSSLQSSNLNSDISPDNQVYHQEENPEDFFKDMVPQIRKPKKIYVRQETDKKEVSVSSRLSMDPTARLMDPDLGVMDDNPSTWEDEDISDESWDPNQLIRETKRVEREKRLAEHQRRKQERETRRASRQDSSSNMPVLNLSDSKPKFS